MNLKYVKTKNPTRFQMKLTKEIESEEKSNELSQSWSKVFRP